MGWRPRMYPVPNPAAAQRAPSKCSTRRRKFQSRRAFEHLGQNCAHRPGCFQQAHGHDGFADLIPVRAIVRGQAMPQQGRNVSDRDFPLGSSINDREKRPQLFFRSNQR